MDTCNLLQIIMCLRLFYLHTADSFVITKFDTNTIINYFNHVRRFNGDKAVKAFLQENLADYCYTLRKSYMFESTQTPIDGQNYEEIIPTYYNIPENLFEVELKQGTVRTRRFRVMSENQTYTFHSIQCLNHKGEPKWFITPAFIPDSAFLFEVEPNFLHVVSKQTIPKVHNEIPARLIAIIDEDGTESRLPLHEAFDAMSVNENLQSTQRDSLCDLNHILQRRICVIVADVLDRSLSSDDESSQTFREQSTNVYYQPEDIEKNCKRPTKKIDEPIYREMLYCTVRILGKTSSFYLASNISSDPSAVLYFDSNYFGGNWIAAYGTHSIPILEHLQEYNKVLD